MQAGKSRQPTAARLGERSRERQLAPGALVPTASTPSTCDLRAIKIVYLLRCIDPRRLFITASIAKFTDISFLNSFN